MRHIDAPVFLIIQAQAFCVKNTEAVLWMCFSMLANAKKI